MSTGYGRNRWGASGFKNALPAGTSLQNGKYTLIEVYGQGPFTVTYLARQNILGKQVVINELFLMDFGRHAPDNGVINEGLGEEVYGKFREKWFEIAILLSRCSRNENFVTVLDAFGENNTVYYVTDYVSEEDLRTYTLGQKEKRLEEAPSLNIMSQLFTGLSFLHENHIFHLNLSPIKVLIEKGSRVVIFSVGIARDSIPPEIVPDITALARTGYTAPELYLRDRADGKLADIYSMGAILYFLLTGKDPLPAPERKGTVLTEPKKLNPSVSAGTSAAVMKAMSMDPADRYRTLDEFMLALRKRPVPGGRKKTGKILALAAGVIVLLALAAAGIIALINRGNHEKPESAGTEQGKISKQVQLSRLTLQQDVTRGITMLSDGAAKDTVVIGKNYALLIGIGKYRDPRYQKLSQPVGDAKALAGVLISGYTFDKNNVTLLEDPDKNEIFRVLNYYRDSITPNDNLFVFYAGHGRYYKKADLGYIIPVDGDYQNDAAWISFQDIREKFNIIPAKHILLIADACFAGSVFRGEDTGKDDEGNTLVFDQISRRSRTAFTSAYLQPVPDRSEFLRHLISTLKNNREKFFLSEDLYINTRNSLMKSTSKSDPVKYGVIRDCGDEGGDFIFIRREK
jgi:hypothetical protein